MSLVKYKGETGRQYPGKTVKVSTGRSSNRPRAMPVPNNKKLVSGVNAYTVPETQVCLFLEGMASFFLTNRLETG
ncbi:MAG: hypothetical protein JWQ78_1351 [Sediminibacterium sp.]|nr:hypothetical protein [Sediminibacterium sp.]